MAKQFLNKGIDRAREKFEDIEDSTERYIKRNPLKSVLIALGMGALLGAGAIIGVESIIRSRIRKRGFWEKYNPFN